ncbi:MAG: MFS transporter [Myxococcota bacterium]
MTRLRDIGAYRTWLATRVAGSLGTQVQLAALGWGVWGASEDPLDLAWLGIAQFLPVLLLALPAGTLADQVDRRKILYTSLLAQAALSLVAAGIVEAGRMGPWAVVVLGLGMGTVRAFAGPASQALLPRLVPGEVLPRALATGSIGFQLAMVLGPSLAGLTIGLGGGAAGALLVAAGLQALGAAVAFGLPTLHVERGATRWRDLVGGLTYVFETRLLLAVVSLDLFAVLLGGATALLPIFATDVLGAGPELFGVLRAAPAVGAGAMALWLARFPLHRHAGAAILGAVALFGAATVVFGLSTVPWLSVAALGVLGAADMISVVVRQTVVQLRTPDALRGRVSSVNLVFIGASNELGEFESGLTARLLGAVPAVVLGGIGTVAVVAVWSGLFPELRRADRLDEIRAEEPGA